MSDKIIYLIFLILIYVPCTYLAGQESRAESLMVGMSGMLMITLVGWFIRRYP